MTFEKNIYNLSIGSRLIKPFIASLLLLLFFHQPILAFDNFNEACEGVDFNVEISLVRGVCESGEQAIVNIKVVDGTTEEYGYDFSDDLGNTGFDILSGNSQDIFSLPANVNYCVTVERQETEGLCIKQVCIEIPTVSTLNCQLEITEEINCEGEPTAQLLATVSGGQGMYIYQWSSEVIACSDGAATDVSAEAGETISNLAPGKYTLTVTDATGCSSNQKVCSIEICAPTVLGAELEATQPDCDGIAVNGAIMAFPEGGAGEYTYEWTGPDRYTANTANIENLAPGLYTLLITDGRGCTVSADTELMDPGCRPEEPEAPCDCDEEADNVELFDIPVYKLKKKKRGRRCSYTWVKIGTQKIRFLGTVYDEATNTTKFTYRLSSCDAPNVRNVIFGNMGRRFRGCYVPGNVLSATGAQCVYWKRGDYTGISGVKFDHLCWHDSECANENQNSEVSFTMPGNVGVSTEGFFAGIRAGRGLGRVQIPGPDCNYNHCPTNNDLMASDLDGTTINSTITATERGNIGRSVEGGATATTATATTIDEEIGLEMPNDLEEIDPVLEVFPNPTIEYVNIVLDHAPESAATLEVTDASGKLIHTRNVAGGYSSQRIDLSKQPQGVYLISIKGDGIIPSVHKIMKR